MTSAVKPIPEGCEAAIPYLYIKGAAEAIEFYKRAFGATELMRRGEPGGPVGHAEIRIGNATVYLADEFPDRGVLGPKTIGGTPVVIHMYVEDVDACAARAIEAGARVIRPIEDQFYGDRGGKLEDPFGHQWWIATHKEDLSLEEMNERAKKLYGGE